MGLQVEDADVDLATALLSSQMGVEEAGALADLCRRLGRLVFWLRVFAAALALFIIAPVQAAVLTAPRVAVAGGLLIAVGAVTALIRRGQLSPAGACAVAGIVAVVAGLGDVFIPVPRGAGSGGQWTALFVAMFLAIPTARMTWLFARGCAVAGLQPARVVQAARIPPLTGVVGVRELRVQLGFWAPALLIVQLLTSSALLCVSALNTLLAPLPVGGWIGRVLDGAYGRTRHDLHDQIGRIGGYRGRPRLALFAGPRDDDAKLRVRSDALRWGECLPRTVHFSEYLAEQLWLYGVPCLVHGVSDRAWTPRGGDADIRASTGLVLLVAPGTRAPSTDELRGSEPRALLVLPPGQDVGTIRRELARIAPAVAARIEVTDQKLRGAVALSVEPSGMINLHAAQEKSQWTYMAALDAAAERLRIGETVGDTPVPLTSSLGVTDASGSAPTSPEPAAEGRRLSAKALTALLLGGWGIIVITANDVPHSRGDNHGELVLGMVMAGVALVCGLWATADALRRLRLRNLALSLLGLSAACASTVLGILALGG